MKALNSFRSWAAAGFAAVVLCFAQSIMAQNTYIITGSGTQFTATIDGSVVGDADQTLAIVRDIIKLHAAGDDCVIQFGDGTETLNIGPANIMFDGGDNGTDWGLITLTGKMTSSFTNTTSAVIVTRNGVSVNSMADIANTAATNGHCIIHNSTETLTVNDGTVSTTSGRAIENISTGSVNIIGGTVSATNGVAIRNQSHGSVIIIGGTVSTTSGRAVENQSAGLITVSGGTVLATTSGRAVENQSTGSVNINGGTVSTTSGRTVVNQYTGSVNISGGTVLATTARAIENLSTGKITISGDALVTSANTSSNAGTIVLANSGTATAARLEITGGTITNTADNGNAVYNASTGSIDLGGSPAITGIITKSLTAGNLRVITEGQNTFVPDGKIYKLDFNAATQNNTATVVNGKNFAENFESVNSNFGLEINNNDIVVKYKSAGYTYQKSGTTYVVTHVLANAMVNGPIQTLIDLIKADAAGNLCVIQFGDGMETLDIGAESIEFDDGGTSDWGEVTITGRLTSSNSTSSTGVIFLRNGISLTST
ncbi:MAG: hypothetical protein LBB56_09020, partial [Chitinispirillales bacterium]|nr:hypothetical protein [Chitinispirillales bacterium]